MKLSNLIKRQIKDYFSKYKKIVNPKLNHFEKLNENSKFKIKIRLEHERNTHARAIKKFIDCIYFVFLLQLFVYECFIESFQV